MGTHHSTVSNKNLVRTGTALFGQCQALSTISIPVLEALLKQTDAPVRLESEVLYALLVYTDDSRIWCSPNGKEVANRLLEEQLNFPGGPTKEEFLIETVLQKYLRPLFSRSKPSSITASGRKAEYTEGAASRAESIPEESALTKPWKYTDLRAVPAVAWAVREADVSFAPDLSDNLSNKARGHLIYSTNRAKTNPVAQYQDPTHRQALAPLHPRPAHPRR